MNVRPTRIIAGPNWTSRAAIVAVPITSTAQPTTWRREPRSTSVSGSDEASAARSRPSRSAISTMETADTRFVRRVPGRVTARAQSSAISPGLPFEYRSILWIAASENFTASSEQEPVH